MNRLPIALLTALLALPACRFPRADDSLEPNNDLVGATRLIAGETVQGRANEGDADCFAIEVSAPGTLVFQLADLGHEDAAAFTVSGPDGSDLYRDRRFRGRRMGDAEVAAAGASLRRTEQGYELRVPAATPGRYHLVIEEQPAADNLLAFSWDYRLRVDVE